MQRVRQTNTGRRGIILPFVLAVLGLLALTMAGYVFFIRAETAGLTAHTQAQQARLAAESALEEIVATLRIAKHDATAWYNVPNRFRHALVWSPAYTRENDPVRASGSRNELLASGKVPEAWRYSLCAMAPVQGNVETFRYGITPESSKLNLNTATEQQLLALFNAVLPPLDVQNVPSLVASFLDWRDQDNETRNSGAENEWYNTLTPPYGAKNGPLDTVEELLLIRNFNAIVLWGEDVNRNGLLDPNEDDGDATWPDYDNGDGILNLGIAPYVTVWSREPDTTIDNKPRANLRNGAAVAAQLQALYPENQISPATIGWITQLAASGFDFSQLSSPAQLYTRGYVPPADAGEFEGEDEGGGPSSQPSSGPGGPRGRRGLPAELLNSPVTPEELPYIMDGLTVRDPQQAAQGGIQGLININTASATVLSLLPGMTAENVAALIAARTTASPEVLRSTAWPVTTGAIDTATFHAIAPYITVKAYQFHVEAVGYADHCRTARRLEWIIEMQGPLAQVKYQRDLTSLGIGWPVDRDSIVQGTTTSR
jgi:type II secretory pathway component PulK